MRNLTTVNRVLAEPVRRLLLAAGIFVLLAFTLWFSPRHVDLWWQAFLQFLHAPLFGVIAVAAVAMTPSTWVPRNRLLVALAMVFLLTIVSEAAQIPLSNRHASLSDLVNDWLGALAFVSAAVVLSPNFHVPRGRGRYLVLLAVLLMIWPLKPLAEISAAYWDRFQQLPSIAPFQSRTVRMFFDLNNAYVVFHEGRDGQISSEIHFARQGSSSIRFHDPWSNWHSFETLVLDMEVPGDGTLPLMLRVHDEHHLRGNQPYEDRFNRRLEVGPGRQEIRIALQEVQTAPAGRRMDMGHIDGVVLFGSPKEAGRRFVIHDIRLE